MAGVVVRAVEPCCRQQVAYPSPERRAARAKREDRGALGQIAAHTPASPRQTKAIAKYGTVAGSISANGAIRWFGRVARST